MHGPANRLVKDCTTTYNSVILYCREVCSCYIPLCKEMPNLGMRLHWQVLSTAVCMFTGIVRLANYFRGTHALLFLRIHCTSVREIFTNCYMYQLGMHEASAPLIKLSYFCVI